MPPCSWWYRCPRHHHEMTGTSVLARVGAAGSCGSCLDGEGEGNGLQYAHESVDVGPGSVLVSARARAAGSCGTYLDGGENAPQYDRENVDVGLGVGRNDGVKGCCETRRTSEICPW